MEIRKDKIGRFTTDNFSLGDLRSVEKYFREDKFDSCLKSYLQEDWATSEKVATGNLGHVLDKVHHKIALKKSAKISPLKNFFHRFSRVAAMLFIPALITVAVFTYYFTKEKNSTAWVEVHSPSGALTNLHLPDGTEVWLNSGSSIEYPISFNRNRLVKLSGEAWFDVVSQKRDEFSVQTSLFDVRVLGTQFNVIAFDKEETAEVILEEGKVLIKGRDKKFTAQLTPDQHFVYNKVAQKGIQGMVDSKSYTSWKDGLLIFKNQPMSEIAKRLGRRYDAEVILHGEALKQSVFRATFKDEALEEICKLLSQVAPIKYKIHKRILKADGSFSSKKVEFWLNDYEQNK